MSTYVIISSILTACLFRLTSSCNLASVLTGTGHLNYNNDYAKNIMNEIYSFRLRKMDIP
jgi:hypothetical protein